VRRRITSSSTRFFGQNFKLSPSIIFIDASKRGRVDAPSIRNHRCGSLKYKIYKVLFKIRKSRPKNDIFQSKNFKNFSAKFFCQIVNNFIFDCQIFPKFRAFFLKNSMVKSKFDGFLPPSKMIDVDDGVAAVGYKLPSTPPLLILNRRTPIAPLFYLLY